MTETILANGTIDPERLFDEGIEGHLGLDVGCGNGRHAPPAPPNDGRGNGRHANSYPLRGI